MKRAIGIIPARLKSTRLPRKMLADIGGRPLIWYTIQQAKKAKLLDEVIVATDSKEIFNVAVEAGVGAVMTSAKHRCGSDRIAEAVGKLKHKPDIVINVQGDEPIIAPAAIDAVVRILTSDPTIPMATVAAPFEDRSEIEKQSCVKVVLRRTGDALYFSRSVVPFPRSEYAKFLKHIGIFGFQRKFLLQYVKIKPTPLEIAESLEQLRALEHGYPIRVGVGSFRHHSVDVAEDLEYVRSFLSSGDEK